MEHFLQTITTKVKVWKTHFNSDYLQTIWLACTSLSRPDLEKVKPQFGLQALYSPLPCQNLYMDSFTFSSFGTPVSLFVVCAVVLPRPQKLNFT